METLVNGQISSGPEDFSLNYANMYVSGLRVYSGDNVLVDPLVSHIIGLEHSVFNADPRSWGDPIGVWRTCVTIKNITDNVPVNSATSQADGGTGGGHPKITVGKISKPITYRIKLWANQNDGATPPASGYW